MRYQFFKQLRPQRAFALLLSFVFITGFSSTVFAVGGCGSMVLGQQNDLENMRQWTGYFENKVGTHFSPFRGLEMRPDEIGRVHEKLGKAFPYYSLIFNRALNQKDINLQQHQTIKRKAFPLVVKAISTTDELQAYAVKEFLKWLEKREQTYQTKKEQEQPSAVDSEQAEIPEFNFEVPPGAPQSSQGQQGQSGQASGASQTGQQSQSQKGQQGKSSQPGQNNDRTDEQSGNPDQKKSDNQNKKPQDKGRPQEESKAHSDEKPNPWESHKKNLYVPENSEPPEQPGQRENILRTDAYLRPGTFPRYQYFRETIFDTITGKELKANPSLRKKARRTEGTAFKKGEVATFGSLRIRLPIQYGFEPVIEVNAKAGYRVEEVEPGIFYLVSLNSKVPTEIAYRIRSTSKDVQTIDEPSQYAAPTGIDKKLWPDHVLAGVRDAKERGLNHPLKIAGILEKYFSSKTGSYLYYSSRGGELSKADLAKVDADLKELQKKYPIPVAMSHNKVFNCDGATWIGAALLKDFFGIPTRVVGGKVSDGTLDDNGSRYLVISTGAIKHMWLEVFFEGRWVPFDMTPERNSPLPESDQKETGDQKKNSTQYEEKQGQRKEPSRSNAEKNGKQKSEPQSGKQGDQKQSGLQPKEGTSSHQTSSPGHEGDAKGSQAGNQGPQIPTPVAGERAGEKPGQKPGDKLDPQSTLKKTAENPEGIEKEKASGSKGNENADGPGWRATTPPLAQQRPNPKDQPLPSSIQHLVENEIEKEIALELIEQKDKEGVLKKWAAVKTSLATGIMKSMVENLFHRIPLDHSESLRLGQRSLREIVQTADNSLSKGNLEDAYRDLYSLTKAFQALAKVRALTPREREFVSYVKEFLAALRAIKHESSSIHVLVNEFFRSLPGSASRAIILDQFGDDILQLGSPSQRALAKALLRNKELAVFVRMGLLKRYAELQLLTEAEPRYKDEKTFYRSPVPKNDNDLVLAKSPLEFARMLFNPNPGEHIFEKLYKGEQFALGPRETQRVSNPHKSLEKKRIVIFYDLSISMVENEKEVLQDALLGALVDYCMSELDPFHKPLAEIVVIPFHKTVLSDQAITIRKPEDVVRFLKQRGQFSKAVGKGTNIQDALLYFYEDIIQSHEQAKTGEKKPTRANLILLTDGGAEVDLNVILEKQKSLPEGVNTSFSFFSLGGEGKENAILVKLVEEMKLKVGKSNYKSISIAEILSLVAESKDQKLDPNAFATDLKSPPYEIVALLDKVQKSLSAFGEPPDIELMHELMSEIQTQDLDVGSFQGSPFTLEFLQIAELIMKPPSPVPSNVRKHILIRMLVAYPRMIGRSLRNFSLAEKRVFERLLRWAEER